MKFHFRHHEAGGVIVPTDHPSSLLVIDAHGPHHDMMLDSTHSMTAEEDERHRLGYHGEEHHSSPSAEGIERDLDASRHHGECTHQKMNGSSSSLSSSSVVLPCPSSPNSEARRSNRNESGSPTSTGSSSPTSKRALHLEDGECPHSQRPRSRQFFRLGRHRSRGKPEASKKQEQSASSTFNDGFVDLSSDMPLVDKRTYGTLGCFSDSSDTGEEEEEEDEMNLQQGGHGGGGVANIHRRRSRGISRLRKPLLRRTQSLPIQSIAKPQQPEINITDSKKEGDSIMGGASNSSEGGLAKIVSTTSLTSTATTDINSPTPTKQQRTHRRHVTFTSVSVRQYSTILGDHPCCPSGPPLALGWKFTEQGSMEFETYETQREPERVKSKDKLRLDGDERRGILRSLVVSTTASDPSSSNDAPSASSCDEGENSDAAKKDDSSTTVCLYTQRELARAERRLTRERASNNRAHQRMNRKFFRPLTAEECEIGGSSDSAVSSSSTTPQEGEGETKTDDVGCTTPSPMKELEPLEENRMDISPVNLRMTFASSDQMSFDEEDESSI